MKKLRVFMVLGLLLYGVLQIAMASEAVWIDVRTAEEFEAGHVPPAINIPYEQIAAEVAELGLAYDQPIYLYCRSGRRAGIALQSLQELGYQQVVNVGGLEDAKQLFAGEEKTGSSE
jgi:phage shock protein E